MSVHDFPFTRHALWQRKGADRAQRLARYTAHGVAIPVIDLEDEPRNPDGTRQEWCALTDSPPRSSRR